MFVSKAQAYIWEYGNYSNNWECPYMAASGAPTPYGQKLTSDSCQSVVAFVVAQVLWDLGGLGSLGAVPVGRMKSP